MVVPPNHPYLIRFSITNHPFWGTPIVGNPHMWLGQFYDILPILKLHIWVAKRQQHSPTWIFLPASPLFWSTSWFRQEGYQWKGLKQLGSTCDSTSPRRSSSHISECFQKSRLEGLCSSYFPFALRCRACRSWFSIWLKSHPESVAPLVCISGAWSSMTSEELDPNEAATSYVGAIGLDRS